MPLFRRACLALLALGLATAIWLPAVHLWFAPRVRDYRGTDTIAPQARLLAARHLRLWTDPALRQHEIARMRQSNAEWDFMGRTYLVLALANLALREPAEQARYLAVIDTILDETLRLERERGMYFFLMDYARARPFLAKPARSVFVDGEIALMLAARRLVRDTPESRALYHERAAALVRQMSAGPVCCGESYPDECWMFCNTVAIAALRAGDVLDGPDHAAFIRTWLATVKAKLVDRKTGLLVSSFTLAGQPGDGPEGSSIWMAAHCLATVDPAFARDQYQRARKELAREVLGFAYAKEWPASWVGQPDIDSGPIVPVLGASAGSSGLAVLGAAAFDDDALLRGLLTSLNFAAFPRQADGELRYAASNQVGDAVLLYALVQGPLWRKIQVQEGGR